MSVPLLEIRDLVVHFGADRDVTGPGRKHAKVHAVDGVSLSVAQGEIVGLVGESGCGKTTLARAVMGFAQPSAGIIRFGGKPLPRTRRELRAFRTEFQMVFQDPYASLNPRMTVFDTLAEALRQRHRIHGNELAERVSELMGKVGLAPRFVRKYPHEFSGGQRQRIAIARALAPEPSLLIADEPVSALDVSIQSQIVNLLKRLVREYDLGMIFISHDLSVVHHIADRVAVMYLGEIVESGPANSIIRNPAHPYTRALVSAIPEPDPKRERNRTRIILGGEPPSPINPPEGCRFHTRCPCAVGRCRDEKPHFEEVAPGWHASCLRLDELGISSPGC